MVVAAVAVGVIIAIIPMPCDIARMQSNAIQSAERKKSSWRNDEQARRKKVERQWNLQETLRREEEMRAADEEHAKEVAAAANALAKGEERCVRACVHA